MENTQKKLFNPEGNDSLSERKIIKGDTTNLFNLNEVKYPWAKTLYRLMMSNFWIPEKIDLGDDKRQYLTLTEAEVKAYDGIISFLTFLDSIQTNNLPNIGDYITAPEVSTLITIQGFQEAVHSQSYAYILESIIPKNKRNTVYELWRDDKKLLERNKYIASIYQDFADDSNDHNLARVIIANYILEGLYFYNGFAFFYNLASRNVMLGTADEIRYINRDELSHLTLFENIIKTINSEYPDFIQEKLVHEMFEEGVKQEIDWTNHILGNNILGISKNSTEQYTKYLANKRIETLGFKPLYEKIENPYEHLERLSSKEGEDSVKSGFFEATVTSYSQSSVVSGFEDL